MREGLEASLGGSSHINPGKVTTKTGAGDGKEVGADSPGLDRSGGLAKAKKVLLGNVHFFSFFFHELILPLPLRSIKKSITCQSILYIHVHTHILHVYIQKHLAFQK